MGIVPPKLPVEPLLVETRSIPECLHCGQSDFEQLEDETIRCVRCGAPLNMRDGHGT